MVHNGFYLCTIHKKSKEDLTRAIVIFCYIFSLSDTIGARIYKKKKKRFTFIPIYIFMHPTKHLPEKRFYDED